LEQVQELEAHLRMPVELAVSVPMDLNQMLSFQSLMMVVVVVVAAAAAGLVLKIQGHCEVGPMETAAEEVVGHTLVEAAHNAAAAAVVVAEVQSTLGFQHPGKQPFQKSAVKEASPAHPWP
jgi:hypothetical protein